MLITRRHFARQMAFAAALYGCPCWAIVESHGLFDANKQNSAPPDPQTIRKLASQIVVQVITPVAPDYDAARSIFNRVYDRRRCGRRGASADTRSRSDSSGTASGINWSSGIEISGLEAATFMKAIDTK